MFSDAMLDDIRKRALEPLDSELVWPDVQTSIRLPSVRAEIVSDSEGSGSEMLMVKKRKVCDTKRAQMKYEPPVEVARVMTKEEIAAWRREQRRKRNRESAAASRQRQKDRIVELENEVNQWKAKFDDIMQEIHFLEKNSQVPVPLVPQGNAPPFVPEETTSHATASRRDFETSTPIPLPDPSIDIISSLAAPVSPTQVVGSLLDLDGTEDVLLPYKMISRPAATRIYHFDSTLPLEQRQSGTQSYLSLIHWAIEPFKITIPAVKISGNCIKPSVSDEDLIKPIPCISTVEKPDLISSIELDDPEDVSFLDSLASEDILPPILEDETDLGSFLSDLF